MSFVVFCLCVGLFLAGIAIQEIKERLDRIDPPHPDDGDTLHEPQPDGRS